MDRDYGFDSSELFIDEEAVANITSVEGLASEYIDDAVKSFSEYVIEEAGDAIMVSAFDTDAIEKAINTLERNNYLISDKADEEGERAIAAAPPKHFETFRQDAKEMVRFHTKEVQGESFDFEEVGYCGVDIYPDESLPDNKAVLIHPDAIGPHPPAYGSQLAGGVSVSGSVFRPWLVRYPDGVVVLDID